MKGHAVTQHVKEKGGTGEPFPLCRFATVDGILSVALRQTNNTQVALIGGVAVAQIARTVVSKGDNIPLSQT